MDPQDLVPYLALILGGGFALGMAGILAAVHNTRLKIKHGYPLQGMWGQSLRPGVDSESNERIRLLTQENAQLRAEVSSLNDRMATVERIVTDSGYRLGHEIERLRETKEKVQ